MTIEEELELKIKNFKPPFCPLINGKCMTDCVCFVDHKILNNNSSEYLIDGGFCANFMLHGAT